ncbi:MAG TPA: PLP-dependent aspartate aminotransferase family protein [Jiangellaceae bacterium]
MTTERRSIETAAVHAGERRPGPDGSLVFPIFQGTVFESEPGEAYDEIKYLRLSTTPSQVYLHDKLAALEGAQTAVATASGMAAVSSALLSVIQTGGHMLVSDVLYGGTHSLLTDFAERLGWSYTFVDPADSQTWKTALRPETTAFLVESVTNPLLRVGDLRGVAEFSRENGLVSVIDNTFTSPVNFRPVEVGFDLVLHSATKYLGGHSDLVAGCVVGSTERIAEVRSVLSHFGGTLDPHVGFLLARGLKTLAVRVKAQNANAMALARELAAHPGVDEVYYPGLESHPDHARAAELFDGFGGMLAFRLGDGQRAERFIDALTLPYRAPSLGGVESLVTQPVKTSHSGLSRADRERIGVTDDLVRFSCGVESMDDLVADVRSALDAL